MKIKARHVKMARAAARCSRRNGSKGRIRRDLDGNLIVPSTLLHVAFWHRNECDLMRAMMDVVNLYKADISSSLSFAETTENTAAEIARAADWLQAKYGSKP